MAKEQIGARIAQDRYEGLVEFEEERDISQSNAIERLIGLGLEAEEIREERDDEREMRIRLEERVGHLEAEVGELEDDLDAAERDAREWRGRYHEVHGRLEARSETIVGRLRKWYRTNLSGMISLSE